MSITRRSALQRQTVAGLSMLNLPGLASVAQAATANRDNAESAPANPAAARQPLPFALPSQWPQAAELLAPSAVHLGGWLGQRVAVNASQRLLHVDTAPLLVGFQHKPGSHPWIGEHVGKWLHAATLAWAYTGDAALRRKLDAVASELIAAQEADGYLGTYVPEKRFGLYDQADWDVWSHKYCLLGLLSYYQYTGHAPALQACRQAADLLLATFPAKRSILAAGTHEGMAATSVLEPMVLLYRVTGEVRYLGFAQYIVQAWDEPKGPGLLKALLAGTPLNQVSNGKAYEMLSNLVGLCELLRATGEAPLLQALRHAWQDLVSNRLYVTGSTSQFEHFQPDHDMQDTVFRHIAETCVTTTWIQFNLALLQLTGEARFGDELERSFYNHLSAAQHPGGDDWCYYTALEGRKQYDAYITCCHSSGPRGMALAPLAAYLRGHAAGHDVVLVNSLESSSATVLLDGQSVRIEQHSEFPYRGESVLTLRMNQSARFALKVRAPSWALPLTLAGSQLANGWAELPLRTWHDGDRIPLRFTLRSRLLRGEYTHAGRAALAWGPFVLAQEQRRRSGLPAPRKLGLLQTSMARATPAKPDLRFAANVDTAVTHNGQQRVQRALFKPFADAGTDQASYQVWLRAPGVAAATRAAESLLADGEESRSRTGNGPGSIIDDKLDDVANTWNGEYQAQDWFAVTLERATRASRFVFTHGKNYHDGGWFDTQHGKPLVQVQRQVDGPWETIGVLHDYPATSAAAAPTLAAWQPFELRLPQAVRFIGVRVLGKPSSGDRPQQSFVTCAELQAFLR